jgi:hypothetical protein
MKTSGDGPERDFDGGKKIKGSKRHLIVNMQGLMLAAKVHAPDVADRDDARGYWVQLNVRFHCHRENLC